MTYTTIDRIIAGILRDTKMKTEIEESSVIEWAGEALDFISAPQQYQEVLELLSVADYKVLLPSFLHKIIQVAYKYSEVQCSSITDLLETTDTEEETTTTTSTSCAVICNDEGYYNNIPEDSLKIASFEEYYQTNTFRLTKVFYDNFQPLRLATTTFKGLNELFCVEYNDLVDYCGEEYSIDGPYIKTSFRTGTLLISYLRHPIDDDTGFPLIPDETTFIEAIKRYCTMKMMYGEFLHGHTPPAIYAKIEQDWHWYCRQARARAQMPKTIDEYQNIYDQMHRLIPRETRYYGYFGNLSNPEGKIFRQFGQKSN